MKKGTLYQIPSSGRWRARLPRVLGGGERRFSKVFDTQREAAAWLSAAVDAAEADRAELPPEGTLRAWGATWLDRRERRGLSDVATDRGRWARFIEGSDLGDLALKALTPPRVASWARWLAEQPRLRQVRGGGWQPAPGGVRVSRQTQTHALNLLRCALDAAVIDGLLPSNPAAAVDVELADAGDDAEAWTWLTQEEIAQLLRCERIPEPARLLYQVAIYTGLRAGELWALRWEVVRLGPRPQVSVTRSNRRSSTKSGKVRAVPLLPQALEALQRWHALCGAPTAGLVFPGEEGRQRPRGDDGGWADRKRGARPIQLGHHALAGITRDVRFHDLRHTCGSHLVQGTWGRRWSLEEVRDLLGHSTITVTQRYAHLDPAALHAAAAATNHPPGGLDPAAGAPASPPAAPSPAQPSGLAVGAQAQERAMGGPQPAQVHEIPPERHALLSRGSQVRDLPGAPSVSGPEPSPTVARSVAQLAQDLLVQVAAGEAVKPALMVELARSVLAEPAAALALRVLEAPDDERRLALAAQLAAHLIAGVGKVRQVG